MKKQTTKKATPKPTEPLDYKNVNGVNFTQVDCGVIVRELLNAKKDDVFISEFFKNCKLTINVDGEREFRHINNMVKVNKIKI